ncbi:hypothetical protein HWC54_gp080 [Klebsiella phage Marfa]|uniref:Uncharacterized protein n=1 Tax=Klebsiella phage Marfa TaxID=2587809 RepID=A0A4Y5TQR5_9CAUD|nr:hypothetical protein HWC54_gp080 [Klebsiella phage Marfa]QDB71735.1 hypothetical protein CPT_Marfa_080 [Klebsiella phage Marfa]
MTRNEVIEKAHEIFINTQAETVGFPKAKRIEVLSNRLKNEFGDFTHLFNSSQSRKWRTGFSHHYDFKEFFKHSRILSNIMARKRLGNFGTVSSARQRYDLRAAEYRGGEAVITNQVDYFISQFNYDRDLILKLASKTMRDTNRHQLFDHQKTVQVIAKRPSMLGLTNSVCIDIRINKDKAHKDFRTLSVVKEQVAQALCIIPSVSSYEWKPANGHSGTFLVFLKDTKPVKEFDEEILNGKVSSSKYTVDRSFIATVAQPELVPAERHFASQMLEVVSKLDDMVKEAEQKVEDARKHLTNITTQRGKLLRAIQALK